tara:strand:+ start:2588 stop:3682 length:1095 start_codon:yes stop_codon:yes gene_type:complete
MQLADEDTLRLNVLATTALAIRINEETMCVEALTEHQTHRIQLKPIGNPDRYLRAVRESLSVFALGTRYPVFIHRWTRTGALETERLAGLLRLGEAEAVVAVAASPNLDDELAQRAWWCMPTAEVARLMLSHPDVATGSTGPKLSQFLLDHLPFEDNSRSIIDTVKLLLCSRLLNDEEAGRLRARAEDHVACMVGFLSAGPSYLYAPQATPRFDTASDNDALMEQLLQYAVSRQGETFLRCAHHALKKAVDMDTVVDTLKALGEYGKPLCGETVLPRSAQDLQQIVESRIDSSNTTLGPDRAATNKSEDNRDRQSALITLSLCGEPLVAPFFAKSDAVGSLMRRKLKPVLEPVFAALETLMERN